MEDQEDSLVKKIGRSEKTECVPEALGDQVGYWYASIVYLGSGPRYLMLVCIEHTGPCELTHV